MFRLPAVGWVMSGPLPPSVNSTSSSFKRVVEDYSPTDQIKSWYELESYDAFKQVDARSASDKHALSVLNSETVHNGERYIVPMLWIDSNVSLPNNYYSSLAQFKTLERRLKKTLNCAKDTQRQLERTLGMAMSLPSNRMIHVSVPIASGILHTIPS